MDILKKDVQRTEVRMPLYESPQMLRQVLSHYGRVPLTWEEAGKIPPEEDPDRARWGTFVDGYGNPVDMDALHPYDPLKDPYAYGPAESPEWWRAWGRESEAAKRAENVARDTHRAVLNMSADEQGRVEPPTIADAMENQPAYWHVPEHGEPYFMPPRYDAVGTQWIPATEAHWGHPGIGPDSVGGGAGAYTDRIAVLQPTADKAAAANADYLAQRRAAPKSPYWDGTTPAQRAESASMWDEYAAGRHLGTYPPDYESENKAYAAAKEANQMMREYYAPIERDIRKRDRRNEYGRLPATSMEEDRAVRDARNEYGRLPRLLPNGAAAPVLNPDGTYSTVETELFLAPPFRDTWVGVPTTGVEDPYGTWLAGGPATVRPTEGLENADRAASSYHDEEAALWDPVMDQLTDGLENLPWWSPLWREMRDPRNDVR